MPARRYEHAGREVEAMRFVGNGPDVAAWCGGSDAKAAGVGLSGSLEVWTDDGFRSVEIGDFVLRHRWGCAVVAQEVFALRYRRIVDG